MIKLDVEIKNSYSIVAKNQIIDDAFFMQFIDDALANTASDLLYKIVKATNAGKDAFNKPFLPYSSGYIKTRLKKGLGTFPNLQLTSDMIKSLTITKKSNVMYLIEVQGMGSEGISNNQKLYYVLENQTAPRKMLESSKHYQKYCSKRFSYHLQRILKKLTK